MYEILRVPHQEDQFMKAFNMMIAYSNPPIYKYDFKEFYRLVKEVYMISDGCSYLGAGAILHKEYKNFELPYIFRSYGNNVYELLTVDFDKQDSYKKYYELIRTLIKDSNDRMIFCEVPNTNRALLNALKGNRFKPNKGNDRKQYSQTLFYTPIYSKLIETELFKIDPRDDLHTIDKMNSFNCNEYKIKEAQDKYTQELIEKNLSEISYEIDDDSCCCEKGQTEEEFLDEGNRCCCPNIPTQPIDYSDVKFIGGSNETVEFCDKDSCEGCMYDHVQYDKLPYFCQSNWLKHHKNPAIDRNCNCT